MEEHKNEYHISFFKPTTEHARLNRNMVIWFVLIWVVAIFGFQLALYVLQKPTPEPVLKTFKASWPAVSSGQASTQELQDHSFATLSVLGKVFIKPEYRKVLDRTLSRSVLSLCDSAQKVDVMANIQDFRAVIASIDASQARIDEINTKDALSSKQKKEKIEPLQKEINAGWEQYSIAKEKLVVQLTPILGLETTDVRTRILPLELTSSLEPLTDEEKMIVEKAMDLYLIHNQSVLTDTKLFGFPFHYFYTAIFLLILFVGLCWLYCVRTDKINARLNVVD
ncbi:MAG: DUF4212 domain-containing protein [Bacteroidales bacterium]|nr:DUF4212 domain-containing protein [Bacteroidales bacterium]